MGTTPPITTNNPQNTRPTKPDQAKRGLSCALPTPRRSLRRGITAAEHSELATTLNANEEFYRIPNQSGSLSDPSQFLGARKQVIIECHSGSHVYLRSQDSTIYIII